MQLKYVWRLMRLDKPIGIWLLLWPTWQTAFLINNLDTMDWRVFAIVTIGVFVMRSIGCVVNDLCDIKFDVAVARTKNRPLVTGKVTPFVAKNIVFVGLVLAGLLVLQLPVICFYLALIGVALVVIYPLSKRWFICPQLLLGVVFGLMPVLITFAAFTGGVTNLPWVFCFAATIWPIAYDNLYAMADKQDDLKLDLYSSAKFLGKYDWLGSVIIYLLWWLCWVYIAWQISSVWLVLALVLSLVIFYPKLLAAKNHNPISCMQAFKFNAVIGLLLCVALLLSAW